MTYENSLPKAWEEIGKKIGKDDIIESFHIGIDEKVGDIGYVDIIREKVIGFSNGNVSGGFGVKSNNHYVLPIITISSVSDANDLIPITENFKSLYKIGSSVNVGNNFPSGAKGGYIESYKVFGTRIIQNYFDNITNSYFTRTKINDSWSDWREVILSDSKIFLGNSGISKVIYIQDAGQKTAGNGYMDKTTGQLYLCKTTNSDTSVTSNFVLTTNIENSKKLDNLSEINSNQYGTYIKHSNGILEMFGETLIVDGGNKIVNFPISFKDENYSCVAIAFLKDSDVDNDDELKIMLGKKYTNRTTANIMSSQLKAYTSYISWYAIGKWK